MCNKCKNEAYNNLNSRHQKNTVKLIYSILIEKSKKERIKKTPPSTI